MAEGQRKWTRGDPTIALFIFFKKSSSRMTAEAVIKL